MVLDLFSVERPDWGPTDVANELGIAKSTAHALLGELASVGLERVKAMRLGGTDAYMALFKAARPRPEPADIKPCAMKE